MIFHPPPPIDPYDPRLLFPPAPTFRRIWLSERDDTIAALVSPEDYDEIISRGLWFRVGSGYAVKTFQRPGERRGAGSIYMHRLICEWAYGPAPSHRHVGDHLNGNRLDNRRSNLRWASVSQNNRNRNGWALRNPELAL